MRMGCSWKNIRAKGANVLAALVREPVLAHAQGDNHAVPGPVEGNYTSQLSGHASVHHLAPKAINPDGSHDSGAAAFGPHHDNVVLVSIAGHIQGATRDRKS